MNLHRLRELVKAWHDGSIREAELIELRDALPAALDFAADRFWPVCQAWIELNACTKAWRERVAYCDANNIDHSTDVHTFVCEWFSQLAIISYGHHVYDLLGPPPEYSCTSAERAKAEKSLLFWIDRLRMQEITLLSQKRSPTMCICGHSAHSHYGGNGKCEALLPNRCNCEKVQ